MAKTKFKRLLLKINLFSAAQLTVISFIVASIIGGLLLFYTERNREVTIYKPEHIETVISAKDVAIDFDSIEETHTKVATYTERGISLTDAIFTSTSALCVTGLTSTDFASFTLGGQIVVMVLIQMGGLGIILFTSLFALAVFRGLSERMSVRNLLSGLVNTSHHQLLSMLKYITLYTILFEGFGTILMGWYLSSPEKSTMINGENPWWWSLFHAISAFNNAGFSLNNNNLENFRTDGVVSLVIAGLLIAGGLGYPLLVAVFTKLRKVYIHKRDKVQLQLEEDMASIISEVELKVALAGTAILLIVGLVITLVFEWTSVGFSDLDLANKLLVAFFQSATTRTAGFNTIPLANLHIATLFTYIILMFIGANPGGTAGGIKIPTMAVLYGYVKDWFASPGEPVKLFQHKISKFSVSHAVRLFFFSVVFVVFMTFLIAGFENEYLLTVDSVINFQKILFEVVSAFGTTGLSIGFPGGVTSFAGILSEGSRVILIIAMLVGRVGPLTLLQAQPLKAENAYEPISPDFENSTSMQIG